MFCFYFQNSSQSAKCNFSVSYSAEFLFHRGFWGGPEPEGLGSICRDAGARCVQNLLELTGLVSSERVPC